MSSNRQEKNDLIGTSLHFTSFGVSCFPFPARSYTTPFELISSLHTRLPPAYTRRSHQPYSTLPPHGTLVHTPRAKSASCSGRVGCTQPVPGAAPRAGSTHRAHLLPPHDLPHLDELLFERARSTGARSDPPGACSYTPASSRPVCGPRTLYCSPKSRDARERPRPLESHDTTDARACRATASGKKRFNWNFASLYLIWSSL